MDPLPTVPFSGGPFAGQFRPIINGHYPATVERLIGGEIHVYEMQSDRKPYTLVYRGVRRIGYKAVKMPPELVKV